MDRPTAIVARTVKGRGVSFMEHPVALVEGGGTYRWHAGAPDDATFSRAFDELHERVAVGVASLGVQPLRLEGLPPLEPEPPASSLQGEPESGAGTHAPARRVTDEYVVDAFGETLLELAAVNDTLVVLDADLASDCRVRGFELAHPARFLENGIAEQDMVSMAAGLARHGLLPVVNSFASFLVSRANEQIYNQASEGSKVIYALHYAGLVPAGPGKSHQSVRDISLLGALPNVTIVQPSNAGETRALLRWAVDESRESVAIRLAIGPSPRLIETPDEVRPGRGTVLLPGDAGLVLSYGPVMLHEALGAAEALRAQGVRVAVAAMPWLNRFDGEWLASTLEPFDHVFVVEDHAPVGALGDAVRRHLAAHGRGERYLTVLGVDGWPACGTPREALGSHGLDAASVARRIQLELSG
jgi:transketolase